jgi:uncharacterized YccA/Bax inhibitor family protein
VKLPTDEVSLYQWILALMVAYLVIVYVACWFKTGNISNENRFVLTRIFDGATFSGSLVLLGGIVDDDLLKLLGDTKPFLLIAGLAGLIYSLHSIAGAAD